MTRRPAASPLRWRALWSTVGPGSDDNGRRGARCRFVAGVDHVDAIAVALFGVAVTVAVQIASAAWFLGRLKGSTEALRSDLADLSARVAKLEDKLQALEVDVRCNARDLHFVRNTLTPIVLDRTDAEQEHRRRTSELLERIETAVKPRGGPA